MAEASTTLPPELTSVAAARRLVATALAAWDRANLAEPATLLTSELVTNAVLHARTDIRVTVRDRRPGVRVEVEDQMKVPPVLKRYATDAATGRGLTLVAAVAATWGVEATNGGKSVWFMVEPGADDPPPVEAPDLDAWPDLEDEAAAPGYCDV